MRSSQLILIISLLALSYSTCYAAQPARAILPDKPAKLSYFNRSSFPDGFVFGASSAAYQYEGAVNIGGRLPSIWDTFTHKFPEKIADGSNGDVVQDFYHRYKEDVKRMKFIGIDSFRFSISWSRVIPTGKLSGGVNKEGVAFYNNLINELLANGIRPLVTIFHWDLPQPLADEYGGFLSPKIVKDFRDFAELCFKEFGDRVKYWATVNEPYIFSLGYDIGTLAPGRCSAWMSFCPAGDSSTEPYLVGHNILLSHAQIVKLYREKYQVAQKGQIGIVFPVNWMLPYSNTNQDIEATQRGLDFMYGWFMDPVIFGHYPKSMRTLVGKRLPKFTAEQANLVKGSFDFIGLNYYTGTYVQHVPTINHVNVSMSTDPQANPTPLRNGQLIGTPTGVSLFHVYPRGLKELLLYTKNKYNNPTVYVTENGLANANDRTKEEEINDHNRVEFIRSHILAVHEAIKEGANVKGYYVWSFLDTFEWNSGFTVRFGLHYIDYKNGLKRYIKTSGIWFKNFLLK